jgi:hypothetical protein
VDVSVFSDVVTSALGGSSADAETVSLIQQIVVNETSGKTGLPSFGQAGGGATGFEFAALRPYLKLYLYQQENPWFFPVVGGAFLALAIYGLLSIAGVAKR